MDTMRHNEYHYIQTTLPSDCQQLHFFMNCMLICGVDIRMGKRHSVAIIMYYINFKAHHCAHVGSYHRKSVDTVDCVDHHFCVQSLTRHRVYEDIHYIWNTNMAAWPNLGNQSLLDVFARPVWAEVTYHFENHKVISLSSVDRHLDSQITV